MNHGKTYHTVINALETFVHVPFPQNESIHDTAILKKIQNNDQITPLVLKMVLEKKAYWEIHCRAKESSAKKRRHVRLLLVHILT